MAAPTGVTVSPNSATVSAGAYKAASASVSPPARRRAYPGAPATPPSPPSAAPALSPPLSLQALYHHRRIHHRFLEKGDLYCVRKPCQHQLCLCDCGQYLQLHPCSPAMHSLEQIHARRVARLYVHHNRLHRHSRRTHQGTTVLTADDNSGDGSNFLITRPLTAGTQYFIKIRGASSSVSGNNVLSVGAAQISPTGVTVSPGSSSVSAGGTKQSPRRSLPPVRCKA